MKRNLLIYAAGGIGKSSRAAQAAKYLYEKEGLQCRVVNADGGGTLSAFQSLVDLGAAQIWDVDTWDQFSIFDLLDKATKGYFPSDVSTPNSPLLPPFREWRQCPSCKAEAGGSGFKMPEKCSSCGSAFGAGVVLPVKREPINGMEKVGVYVFEGLTAFGENLLRRLRTIDSSGGNSINDPAGGGSFKVSSPGMQHYGAAQSYMAQFVSNSRQIGVPLTIWTALELKSDDDGKPIYGPAGPGKKLTAQCIPWFTDVIHLDAFAKKDQKGNAIKKDGVEELERVFFLAPHFPPDVIGYKFAAKTSAPFGGEMPTVMPADMKSFFEALDAAAERSRAAVRRPDDGREKASS